MKRNIRALVCVLLCAVMMISLASLGVSALSPDVTDDTWGSLELQALYIQSGYDIFSDLNENYYEFWWYGEVPEAGGECYSCTVNMRGFAMSPDGRYLYMCHLNEGTGVRGVLVFDTEQCLLTDLYYIYDGETGLDYAPFSHAKGIAADDRGYVYAGFSFSKNYNEDKLGIAKQQEDGTLEEVALEVICSFGVPGDESGIHVGINGVDVARVGDKYYCYLMLNYEYDALYCYDVTDPENPKLNKDFGQGGCIIFSDSSNTVAGNNFTLDEGQYMDVDDDGVIWLAVNAKEGVDGIMKITPDGSACVDVAMLKGVYCVEHEGGYLLCGLRDGSAVVVLDDTTYETVATIPLTAEYGDRITRIQIVNDILFVSDAGNDATMYNAVQVAPLTDTGYEFFNKLVANLNRAAGDTEAPTETEEPTEEVTTEAPTEAPTETPTEEVTEAPSETPTEAPTQAPTEPVESGCGSALGFGVVALLIAAAAFLATKKD